MRWVALLGCVALCAGACLASDLRALVGRINASEDDAQVLALLSELAQAAQEQGDAALAREARELRALVATFRETLLGRPVDWRRRRELRDALDAFSRQSPLFPTAAFYAGRVHYWRGRESGDEAEYKRAGEYFAARAERVAPGPLVRMYLGEKVAWSAPEVVPPPCPAPRWAALQYELLQRLLYVIHYWVNERQQEDGQLGGGWGDDCEILRRWPVALLGADDELARRGMRRLVDGLWAAQNLDEFGFPTRVSDVEHVAEDVSDTQPAMLAYAYGDPLYVERCMKPARLMRELWTGVNGQGQRLFRSAWFSATEVRAEKPFCADVFYTARAAKPVIWLAWYGRYPQAVELLGQWLRSWVAAARSNDRGKPRGVLPPAIGFPDGRIGGYGPTWWDPDLRWKYYVWPGAIDLMHEALLAAYTLTGEEEFLWPIEAEAELAQQAPRGAAEEGSAKWCAQRLRGILGPALAKRRLLCADERFDPWLLQYGTPYMKFVLSGEISHLERGLESALGTMRYNLPMMTSEVRFTDRVAVAGDRLLFSMFTGAEGVTHYYPVFAVTWEATEGKVCVCVRRAEEGRLSLWAFNFDEGPRRVAARLWRMPRGSKARFVLSADDDGDGQPEATLASGVLTVRERGQRLPLSLPARRLVLLEVRATESAGEKRELLADVAVARRDVALSRGPGGRVVLRCAVHNIGPREARQVRIRISWRTAEGKESAAAELGWGALAGCSGFAPVVREATVELPAPPAGTSEVLVACRCASAEITLDNNRVALPLGQR